MSQFARSTQSQLGMTVHGCRQAAGSVHVKHCERPDTLAKEPVPQQMQTLLFLAPTVELA